VQERLGRLRLGPQAARELQWDWRVLILYRKVNGMQMQVSRIMARMGRTVNRTTMAGAATWIALIGLAWAVPAWADDPDNCLLCHQYRGLSRLDTDTSRLHLFFTDPDYSNHRRGPHARLACTDCHVRTEVSVIPHKSVTPVDCARACHLGSQSGIASEFSHAHVKQMLQDSAHKPDTLLGLQFSKGPLLSPDQSNCLYCHDEPIFRDPSNTIPIAAVQSGRTFDRCDVCHTDTVPLDVNYYLRHVASRLVPARPPLELAQVCAVCHSDPLVNTTHEMKDSVAGFVRSFHGKAALLGDQSTANCLSCHVSAGDNAHRMLGRNDPKSSVNPVRLADSCRSTECHPGADKSIAATAVHLDLPTEHGSMEYLLAVTFIVLTILTFGPSALFVLLELFQIVVGREQHDDHKVRKLAEQLMADPRGRERLKRFKPRHRVQHWILTVLFTLLVLTGFPMKFADRAGDPSLVRHFSDNWFLRSHGGRVLRVPGAGAEFVRGRSQGWLQEGIPITPDVDFAHGREEDVSVAGLPDVLTQGTADLWTVQPRGEV
jgi:hypothetical protein